MKPALLLLALAVPLVAQSDLSGTLGLDIDDRLIRYSASDDLRDPVADLQRRIDSGETKLKWDVSYGYLFAVLKELNIPVSSQGLVFSKTSFQLQRIAPRTPRAIYFNDDVYIGWIPNADVIEVSSQDPVKGGIFYTLDQNPERKVRFIRRDECLQCHSSPKTLGVPGHTVRSVYTGTDGFPVFQAGGYVTDHRSPMHERWGGWYVTGTHGNDPHMGNVFLDGTDDPGKLVREPGANITSLRERFDTRRYLSPHSDLVALMVLAHQTRMHNLITRVNYEARVALDQQASMNKALGRPEGEWWESTRRRVYNPVEVMLQYMLFADEAPLKAPIAGTSTFAKEFAQLGPRDSKGRSLREFDLKKRLFRYPCSFLVYTPGFDTLPRAVKDRLFGRLWEVLSGKDQSAAYAALSPQDRREVLEILSETKPELGLYFRSRSEAATSAGGV